MIGAAPAAPGVKPQTSDGVTSGDSFADMLAAIDGTALPEDQAAQPAPAIAAAPLPVAATATPDANEDTGTTDMMTQAPLPDAAPGPLAAIAPATTKPASDKTPSDKASSDKNKARPEEVRQNPPANDNSAAIPQAAPMPAPPPPTATAAPAPQSDSTAPVTATAPQSAPAQPSAPQPAANDGQADAADESGEPAEQADAPQAGQLAARAAPNPAAAKAAKPATDARKTAEGPKVAAAKPDGAQPQAKTADTGSDTKQTEAKPDLQKASTRPADPAAPQNNNGPQDAVPTVAAAPAPANSNTPGAASTLPHEAAAPAPHHGPNLNGMAVEISAKAQGGTKQFDIRLDPPELGRVEVRLAIDSDGKTQAHLTADQPQTLDLLRKDSTSLTQALRDAGLDVSQDGLNFSLRNQQQQAGHDQQQPGNNGRAWRGTFAGPVTNETANAASAYAARGLGLLDIKV